MNVKKEILDTIFWEMANDYGCVDVVAATYAHIINLLVAECYEDGISYFLDRHEKIPLEDHEINKKIISYYLLAMLKLHQYEQAVKNIEEIIDLFASAELYNNYAIALYYSNKKAEAIDYLKKAVAMDGSQKIKRNLNKIKNIVSIFGENDDNNKSAL